LNTNYRNCRINTIHNYGVVPFISAEHSTNVDKVESTTTTIPKKARKQETASLTERQIERKNKTASTDRQEVNAIRFAPKVLRGSHSIYKQVHQYQ
jgi:hypothetical protein